MRLATSVVLGTTSDLVNVRQLKFYEESDAAFGEHRGPVQPIVDPLGVRKWVIERIVTHRVWNRRPEYGVQSLPKKSPPL